MMKKESSTESNSKDWFHGEIGAGEAKRRLSEYEAGAYIVRYHPVREQYILSINLVKDDKDGEVVVKHYRVPGTNERRRGKIVKMFKFQSVKEAVTVTLSKMSGYENNPAAKPADSENIIRTEQILFTTQTEEQCYVCDDKSISNPKSHQDQHELFYCQQCDSMIPEPARRTHKRKCGTQPTVEVIQRKRDKPKRVTLGSDVKISSSSNHVISSVKSLVPDIFKLIQDCPCLNNVSLICSNGTFDCNSFILAAMFPLLKSILESQIDEEKMYISMPEIENQVFKELFSSILNQEQEITVSKDLNLEFSIKTNPKTKEEMHDDVKQELLDESIFDAEEFFAIEDNKISQNKVTVGKKKKVMTKKISSEKNTNPSDIGEVFDVNKCIYCGDVLQSKHELKQHYRTHEQKMKYQCQLCDKRIAGKRILKDHMNKVHLKPENYERCSKCNLTISKNQQRIKYNTHTEERCRKIREKREADVVCPDCGDVMKCFQLRKHNHTHHMDRDKCNVCGKMVVHGLLSIHMRQHDPASPCPLCGEMIQNMKLHMDTVHTSDDKKKFQCQDCGKGFIGSYQLKKHQISVHLKTRPFNCRYGCDVSYNDTSNRNQHEKRTHGKLFTVHVHEEKLQNTENTKKLQI